MLLAPIDRGVEVYPPTIVEDRNALRDFTVQDPALDLNSSSQGTSFDRFDRGGGIGIPDFVVVIDVNLPGVWCSGAVLEGLELVRESIDGENLAIIFFIVNADDVPILIQFNAQQFIFKKTRSRD